MFSKVNDPISELEAVVLELSQIFPTHPEQNRFAHALVDALGKISSQALTTEITSESEREANRIMREEMLAKKTAADLEKLKTLIIEVDSSESIEQKEEKMDDEDEELMSGWEEMLRQLFLEDHHLTELPRRKKNEPTLPLLHEEKIQKMLFLWDQIKTTVTDQNKEAFLRVKRVEALEILFKFQAFNHATVTQCFNVSLNFVEEVISALYMLRADDSLYCKSIVVTIADLNLIFANPSKAKALASAPTEKNQKVTTMLMKKPAAIVMTANQ